jgi:hypothetical protein
MHQVVIDQNKEKHHVPCFHSLVAWRTTCYHSPAMVHGYLLVRDPIVGPMAGRLFVLRPAPARRRFLDDR